MVRLLSPLLDCYYFPPPRLHFTSRETHDARILGRLHQLSVVDPSGEDRDDEHFVLESQHRIPKARTGLVLVLEICKRYARESQVKLLRSCGMQGSRKILASFTGELFSSSSLHGQLHWQEIRPWTLPGGLFFGPSGRADVVALSDGPEERVDQHAGGRVADAVSLDHHVVAERLRAHRCGLRRRRCVARLAGLVAPTDDDGAAVAHDVAAEGEKSGGRDALERAAGGLRDDADAAAVELPAPYRRVGRWASADVSAELLRLSGRRAANVVLDCVALEDLVVVELHEVARAEHPAVVEERARRVPLTVREEAAHALTHVPSHDSVYGCDRFTYSIRTVACMSKSGAVGELISRTSVEELKMSRIDMVVADVYVLRLHDVH